MKRILILAHAQARRIVAELAMSLPDGTHVRFSDEKKTRLQEERYHAMLGDLSEQWTLHGRKWDEESMKRLCVDQFRRDTAKDPDLAPLWEEMGTVEMAPSIDGSGVVALGWQTRRFPKKLASAFIEWLFALGAELDIRWTDPKERRAA